MRVWNTTKRKFYGGWNAIKDEPIWVIDPLTAIEFSRADAESVCLQAKQKGVHDHLIPL